MSITYIKRITGATNNQVYVESSDSTATCLAADYITAQAANIVALNAGAWTWESNDCIMLSASDGISWCYIDATFDTLTAFASQLSLVPAGVSSGLVAHAGGGQSSATPLPSAINEVGTVDAAGNSVLLPASFVGARIVVINAGANSMQVFGKGTDTINGVAFGTGVAQAAATTQTYTCVIAGNWIANQAVETGAVNQLLASSAVLLDKGTGTVSAGAVTVNHQSGVITATVSTAAAGTTSITFNNSLIASTSVILVSLMGGSNVIPGVQLSCAYSSAGVGTLVVTNNNVAGSALSGTLIIGFVVA